MNSTQSSTSRCTCTCDTDSGVDALNVWGCQPSQSQQTLRFRVFVDTPCWANVKKES